MPIETDRSKMTVDELVTRIRSEMVPLGTIFSYFLVMPIAEEDLKLRGPGEFLGHEQSGLPPFRFGDLARDRTTRAHGSTSARGTIRASRVVRHCFVVRNKIDASLGRPA